MDIKKKRAFNQRMGKAKYPRHQNLAKGGVVKKYADGGVTNTASGPQGPIGGLSNLIGLNNNFQAGIATINPGTNANQIGNAYTGVQNAINAQEGLTNTLAPQAGIGAANQNTLASQYLAQTMGQGPGQVAQAQLAQATGNNVANQAALMAGQRGASANAGLIARQAAQQGAATQQQAVGQAATLEAQQQLAAQQNLANLSANQIGQAGAATTALNTAQQNEQGQLLGANTAYNNENVGMQSNINNVNAATAGSNQQENNKVAGGVAKVASNIPVIGQLFKNRGGEIQAFADGGEATSQQNWAGQYMAPAADAGPNIAAPVALPQDAPAVESTEASGPDVSELAPIAEMALAATGGDVSQNQIGNNPNYHNKFFHEYFAGGGMSGAGVDAIVSPKEVYLNPKQVKEVVERGADPMKIGHHFKGQDKVKRDSLKNDVIKTKLEEGGVVLPIHITTHKDASHRGRKFVERAIAKHMKRPNGV